MTSEDRKKGEWLVGGRRHLDTTPSDVKTGTVTGRSEFQTLNVRNNNVGYWKFTIFVEKEFCEVTVDDVVYHLSVEVGLLVPIRWRSRHVVCCVDRGLSVQVLHLEYWTSQKQPPTPPPSSAYSSSRPCVLPEEIPETPFRCGRKRLILHDGTGTLRRP